MIYMFPENELWPAEFHRPGTRLDHGNFALPVIGDRRLDVDRTVGGLAARVHGKHQFAVCIGGAPGCQSAYVLPGICARVGSGIRAIAQFKIVVGRRRDRRQEDAAILAEPQHVVAADVDPEARQRVNMMLFTSVVVPAPGSWSASTRMELPWPLDVLKIRFLEALTWLAIVPLE